MLASLLTEGRQTPLDQAELSSAQERAVACLLACIQCWHQPCRVCLLACTRRVSLDCEHMAVQQNSRARAIHLPAVQVLMNTMHTLVVSQLAALQHRLSSHAFAHLLPMSDLTANSWHGDMRIWFCWVASQFMQLTM